ARTAANCWLATGLSSTTRMWRCFMARLLSASGGTRHFRTRHSGRREGGRGRPPRAERAGRVPPEGVGVKRQASPRARRLFAGLRPHLLGVYHPTNPPSSGPPYSFLLGA